MSLAVGSSSTAGAADQPQHDYLYWEFPSYGGQQAVRKGDWKGIRSGIFKGDMDVELYNLATDVGEMHNLAADHPEIVGQIEQIMQEAHTPSEQFPFKQLDGSGK